MKLNLLALLLSLGLFQSPTATGRIEGTVLRAGTGEPLANMPVTLISTGGLSDEALAAMLEQISQLVTIGLQGGGGGGSQDLTIRQVTSVLQSAGPGVGTQASVLTDRAGHFAFADVPRGRYTVWVQRFNYFGPLRNGVLTATNSVTLAFDPARPPASINLVMTSGMAISGRVLDGRGQPATGMQVTAYRSTISDGKLVWSPVLSSRAIDDRGEYRISPLPPGDYYVGVTPPANAPALPGQNPAVRTFFPGVTEPAEATKLTLRTADSPGIDFTLRTAPSTFFKISGVALNPAAVPAPDGTVDHSFNQFVLVPAETNLIDSASPQTFGNFTSNRIAGDFELRNVRPGIYDLYPLANYSGFYAGRTVVDVRNSDAPGVRVLVNPLVTLEGRVVLTSTPTQRPAKLDAIRILTKQLNAPPVRGSAPPPLFVNENGQFTIVGPAGVMTMVQVTGLLENSFVSDIRIGTTSVYDTGFELSTASDPLQVVIDTGTAGTVDVTVRTPVGQPGPRATVALVPPEDRRQNPMRYKVGITDNEGRLTLRGVPPGSYTVFAWESVPETAWLNKEFLTKYQAQGTAISVKPGEQINLQMSWNPFDTELR